jgi:IS5 family transposase
VAGATPAYTRVGKFALIKHQRYAHAKKKRANKALRKLKPIWAA